ncbi:MAG: tetratricopeptide repeat protein [Prevotellaceae bacterium]|jgi:Flp pilus assembly protein TadD/outer membrane protein OmpA-like peptidoglycan-associated protein|nr:tetratricopeptide repeat protein [Prevotellaceae bacterium]
MKKLVFLSASLLLVLLFSSCGKDLGALASSNFKANPSPLEVKVGVVNVDITGQFPAKYFNKNAVLTVTPVLKYGAESVKGSPITLQGEKVTGNNKSISYKEGGNFDFKASFDYVPEMAVSELVLEFDVVQKKKTYQVPPVKIADGIVATSTLLSTGAGETGPVIIPDKFQRVIEEKSGAGILFQIQQAELRKSEANSTAVVDFIKKIKEVQDAERLEVSKLEISGYASPDGPFSLNKGLSEKRQKVTVDYINKELKKLKTSADISSKVTAEDWEGFQELVSASTLQDKNAILRVLSSYSDPEQREREIKNLSVAYKALADDILPQLRRARLTLVYNIIGKTDDEIKQLAASNPSELSVEELLYAATLTNDLNEKAAIYQKTVSQYPKDVRGYNNLGQVKFAQNDVAKAEEAFTKALQIAPSSSDVNYNLGLVSLAKGEWAKAESYFAKANGTTGNLKAAQGSLYTAQGEYDKAKTAFASEATNNAGLLQILNADYNGALKTLNAVAKPDATTAYLKAVVGARTNNKDAVYSNLKKAVSLDKSYAQKAAKDIEFSKFASESDFLSIIK